MSRKYFTGYILFKKCDNKLRKKNLTDDNELSSHIFVINTLSFNSSRIEASSTYSAHSALISITK